MRWRSRGTIEDGRQLLLRLPIRIAWVRKARESIARTIIGLLRVVRTPWRIWDGYVDEEAVAGGYSLDEAMTKLEAFARLRAGEALPSG